MIFHDTTLIEIARRRPASPAALGEIPGIGRSKLERYGSAVIAVVAATDTAENSSRGLTTHQEFDRILREI